MKQPPQSYSVLAHSSITKRPVLYTQRPYCLDDTGLIRPQDALARGLPLLAKPLQATTFRQKKCALGLAPLGALIPSNGTNEVDAPSYTSTDVISTANVAARCAAGDVAGGATHG
jgi:hypothetical protein